MTVAMLLIVALCAYIAKLMGRNFITIALVILLGAMMGEAGGIIGSIVGGSADFVRGVPSALSNLVS